MMSSATPTTFTTKLKPFNGTGFPAWGAQVKLVLEITGLWDAVQEPTPNEGELKLEKDAAAAAATGTSPASGTSTTAPSGKPLFDRWMKQKMASSIILSALNEKLAAEVYLLDHPLSMLRYLRMTYNVKCSASVGVVKREYIGLYLDGQDSMVNHIQNTRRVLDELQEQHVIVADEKKQQNFMQSLGPAWNGFVGVLEFCTTFKMMIQWCTAERVRREQQEGRRSSSGYGGCKTAAAFSAEQKPGKQNDSKLPKKKRDMSKVKCYNCQEMGHFARECTKECVQAKSKPGVASMAFTVDEIADDIKREWIRATGT
ncbi:unnamed protein product [Phytophthora fragariaefolia]|uniref:Unnamed protein product n=1 Tax=Phytophthora fragariaefolia TaxID=1490495 RepID=A0A9W6U8V0_9STRA|nr:unnamed protein product [Phytophthora fragariaefolia]